ncbi:MAG: hypothetical protein SFW09_17120 [Hyphomicrobiaceae bacterium]|nr:hypothetical protein [Hyphomicrobiaceae bacterium]
MSFDPPPPQNGTIELRLNALAQLFNSLDPSPFHERDLDADAEAHIVEWARELPRDQRLRIVLHLPQAEAVKARDRGVETALANYFGNRAHSHDLELRELFRIGRRNLSISVPLLVACLLASQLIRLWLGEGPLQSVAGESLVIVGWVANWKPLETFLYDWWPIARRRDLYHRLAAAEVAIQERA